MAHTITTHSEDGKDAVVVEWPEWVPESTLQLMWSVLRNCRHGNEGSAAQNMLGMVNAAHDQLPDEVDRLLKYMLVNVHALHGSAGLCHSGTEVNGKFFRCGLPAYHDVESHLGRLGALLAYWPVADSE